MKNLGKYVMTVFIIASMFVLVTQQINVIQWDQMVTSPPVAGGIQPTWPNLRVRGTSSNKEPMSGNDSNPFIMTNVSVDTDGNTIVKTIDSNGFVDLAENTHSRHQKSSSTNATKVTSPGSS